MNCPHCNAELSEPEIRSLHAKLAVSKRKAPNRDMSNRANRGGRPKGAKDSKPRKRTK